MYKHTAFLMALALLLSCSATDPIPEEQSRVNAWGVTLPPDALDAGEQVVVLPCPEGKHFDLAGGYYEANADCGGAWMYESLLDLDEMHRVVPGVAEKWERRGDTWTFHLRKAKWSDGSPLTAQDFEYAIKRHLDPKTGSTWTWFYADLKNYNEVTSGQMPADELPVKAIDDYTLEIQTEGEVLYLDQVMAFPSSVPVPRKMVEKHGDNWTFKPETCLTNGPWKLESYSPGVEVVLTPNTHYVGEHKPYVEKFIMKPTAKGASSFNAYQAGEVDGLFVDQGSSTLTTAEYKMAKQDPVLSRELYDYSMFATRYLFFDTNIKPWNDKEVREAVTRALDGQTMINVIYGGLGARAYGLLPPGFPSYQKGLNDKYQGYDPEKAKSLLAAAGYPGGKGFPVVTLWHKTYEPSLPKTAQIVQQMLKQNLGITVELKPATTKFFHSSLVEGLIDFGIHNWQYEYLDPSNFLTIFVPELGRHKDWNDSEYNRLIKAANASPNQAERLSMYTRADSLISQDHAASFLYHMGNAQMWKPYVKGIPMTDLGTQNVVYYFLGMHQIYKARK